ncbi:MAG: amidohydrolase [Proteobacteria bacterium]|nr:amidohydrolase [Pseudomonadota bacterium]
MTTTAPSDKSDYVLIKGGVIVTINPADEIIEDGYVLIKADQIISVGKLQDAPPDSAVEEIIDTRNCLIMPGLVNTHTHAAMACFRGLADDLPLKTWLEEYIFPLESRYVNPVFVYQGTLLAGLEMIHSGTTSVCDGYFFEEAAAQAFMNLGLRAVVGKGIVDFPAPDNPDPDLNIENGKKYVGQCPSNSLVTPALFCHSAYTCKPETLQKIKKICQYHSIPFIIHLSETEAETKEIKKRYGTSPIQHLNDLEILDGETIAAHCIWITIDDFPIMQKKRLRVAHCPESTMKLASGVAPVPHFLRLGIPVGLGTDGCASNNNLDMISEMDTAAKVHKLNSKNPAIMDAKTVVRMATIGGAEVLGLQNKVGSLEPGKKADIIILDLKQPHLTPVYNYYSHLVYSASGHDVITVLINGKVIMHNRKVVTVNEKETLAAVEEIGKEIKKEMICQGRKKSGFRA